MYKRQSKQIDTNLPVKSLSVAANGVVAAILEDGDVTWINVYNPCLLYTSIDADFDQLKMAGGYDHNWVLDNYTGQVRKIAVVKSCLLYTSRCV